MNVAIIIAGEIGRRMHSEIPMQFNKARGKPIIISTLDVFEHHSEIDAIEVACIDEGFEKHLPHPYTA